MSADRWDGAKPLSLVISWAATRGRAAKVRRRARVLPACATRIEVKFVETALSSD
jgi:hypothetical protein